MRLRKAMLVLLACSAMAAASASQAQAVWTFEGEAITEPVAVEIEKPGAEPFRLISKVLGSELELVATGGGCASAVTACRIDEEVVTDHLRAAFSFTGVSVLKPASCSTGSSITTAKLTGQVVMSEVAGTSRTFVKFTPESGTKLFEITLTGCAAAGTYPVTGFVDAETEPTEWTRLTEPFFFNNASASISGLKLGKESAVLNEGYFEANPTGKYAGKSWTMTE